MTVNTGMLEVDACGAVCSDDNLQLWHEINV